MNSAFLQPSLQKSEQMFHKTRLAAVDSSLSASLAEVLTHGNPAASRSASGRVRGAGRPAALRFAGSGVSERAVRWRQSRRRVPFGVQRRGGRLRSPRSAVKRLATTSWRRCGVFDAAAFAEASRRCRASPLIAAALVRRRN